MATLHPIRRKGCFIVKYSKVLVVMASGCRSRTDRQRRLRRPSRGLRVALPSPHGAPSSPHGAPSRSHGAPSSRCDGPAARPVAEMLKRRRLWWSGCRASGTPVGGTGAAAGRRPRALRPATERADRAAVAVLPAWGPWPAALRRFAMCRPPPARRFGVPGGIRTHTVGGLSSVSLPVGIRGQCCRQPRCRPIEYPLG